ncbi:MAG TPA: rod shape-determining protein MreC [Blastocatellia bacterium]|nr:rod shape-determining protein MreC [Blastocatellia bacterium]
MTTAEAKKKAPIIFVALVLLQVLLISAQSRPGRTDQQSLLRSAVLTIFAPVMYVTSWAGGNVSYVWHNYAALRHAKEENDQLREENTRLQQKSLQADESIAEADRLRKILNLQTTLPYNSVVGHVITRNTSLWVDRISIDKGTLSGVQKNYPVITPEGVVGHVVAVSPNAAQVQLITDERAGAGARLKTSRTLGEIRGTNGPYPELRNIANLEDVPVGEEVVTSGLDGIYPQGLLIGTVLSAQKRTDDISQRIQIQPAAHLSGFEEVIILQVDPTELHSQIEEALKPPPTQTKGEKKPSGKSTKASQKPAADNNKKADTKKKTR